MIPLSGAEYVYLLEGFGALPVFLHSWTSVVVLKPSQVAIICTSVWGLRDLADLCRLW